jgi:ABC-type Fe3+-citrate transport system substrate-binding protein
MERGPQYVHTMSERAKKLVTMGILGIAMLRLAGCGNDMSEKDCTTTVTFELGDTSETLLKKARVVCSEIIYRDMIESLGRDPLIFVHGQQLTFYNYIDIE